MDRICVTTGKRRFVSELEAREELAEAQRKLQIGGHPHRQECAAFFCVQCEGWHLTSHPAPKRRL